MAASTRATFQSPVEDCLRKHRYPSKHSAKAEARRWPGDQSVYRCPHCGFWHLAHRR